MFSNLVKPPSFVATNKDGNVLNISSKTVTKKAENVNTSHQTSVFGRLMFCQSPPVCSHRCSWKYPDISSKISETGVDMSRCLAKILSVVTWNKAGKCLNVSSKISSVVAWSTAGNIHLVLSSLTRLEMFHCLTRNVKLHYLKHRLTLSHPTSTLLFSFCLPVNKPVSLRPLQLFHQNAAVWLWRSINVLWKLTLHQHDSEEMMTDFTCVDWTVSLSCLFWMLVQMLCSSLNSHSEAPGDELKVR